MKAIWRWLTRPSGTISVLALLVTGVVVGVGGWLVFNGVIHATGTNEFCGTACHSHAAFIYPDHRNSVHYANASGVKATCSDCHIPKEFFPKLWVKAKAGTFDAYSEYVKGTISTPEKYEQELPRLYEQVRAAMKANDSKACRNCHDFTPEVLQAQPPKAARNHREYRQRGQTCIDCHEGVAHSVPGEPKLGSERPAAPVGAAPVESVEPLATKLGCLGCHGVSEAKAAPALADIAGKLKAHADAALAAAKPLACTGGPNATASGDDLTRIADWSLWLAASRARASAAAR
jgi:cytochrome c-type protein NapC